MYKIEFASERYSSGDLRSALEEAAEKNDWSSAGIRLPRGRLRDGGLAMAIALGVLNAGAVTALIKGLFDLRKILSAQRIRLKFRSGDTEGEIDIPADFSPEERDRLLELFERLRPSHILVE